MVGPTAGGVQDLIALDPSAYWDTSCTPPGTPTGSGCINSPLGLSSPRLIRMAFFDPRFPVASGRTYVTAANVGGFFIEGVQPSGDVTGVYTSVPSQEGTTNPSCSFLQLVQLVQ